MTTDCVARNHAESLADSRRQRRQPRVRGGDLPGLALLALATAAFVGILTEALPAGLLPAMSRDMGVSDAAMGHLLTVYAIASAVTAIPLAAVTAAWRRSDSC